MAYSDFTLRKIKTELNINIIEQEALFLSIDNIEISRVLKEILKENIPLARAINTEKARSELIIANILVEVRKNFKHQISLFSGVEFNVDKSKGLNGFCDFILSASSEQLMLNSPVIALVEAKNENIIGGLGQCIAEMVAATIFNKNEHNDEISTLYGIVTTGTAWKFLTLKNNQVTIDLDEYSIENPEKIIGIISFMLGSVLDYAPSL